MFEWIPFRLKEHGAASQVMDEIQVELNEMKKAKKQGVNATKISSTVRKLFLTLNNHIVNLGEVLSRDQDSGAV